MENISRSTIFRNGMKIKAEERMKREEEERKKAEQKGRNDTPSKQLEENER